MCRCYKVCRLCSCTGLVFAGGFLSQPGASKAGRYLTSFPFSSYERPARLLPAVAVASIHLVAEKGSSRKRTGMKRGPEWLCSGLIPSLFIISQARRNVVVAPGRILAINGLVLPMLLLLLLGVVMPRVDAFVRQPTFVLLDVVHDGSKVCATPTGAPGTGGS